jgi:glycerophosphoryl diester phosphodiesterase
MIVIGHRGAPGYRPEHTLASYRLAIAMGADYIEPDLVPTSDGVLVARHENEIGGTTDVAAHAEFADRRTTRTIDGRSVTGWFTEDFTLAELKTLRATERLPQVRPANTVHDGRYDVPTLDEVLELAASESRRLHRPIGVYPETKHPTYFASIGLSLEAKLVQALRRHDLDRPEAKVFLQSFEAGSLRELRALTTVPLVQLIDVGGPLPDLAQIATYAAGVGVHKDLVLPCDPSGDAVAPSRFVEDAHAHGLLVHVWTLRQENRFMAPTFRVGPDPDAAGDAHAEARAFLDAGVDGFFTDHPDTGVRAREDWLNLAAVG